MKIKVSIFLAVLGFSFVVWAGNKPGEKPYDRVGRDDEGKVVRVSDFKGRVVIVTFWATWCGPCMKELPVLSGIQKRAGTEQLQVIAVNYKESKRI